VSQCEGIVENYATQIAAGLASHAGPAQVCQKINLCSKAAASAQVLLYSEAAHIAIDGVTAARVQKELAVAAPADSAACSMCEALVGFVEGYLSQNDTQAQIQKQLDQLCSLTGPYEQICDNLVAQYLPQLIQYVEGKETPQAACTKVGVCSSSAFALPVDPKIAFRMQRAAAPRKLAKAPKAPLDAGCSLCEAIVGFVEGYVAQNETEMSIAKQITKLCQLTGPYEMICDNLVDQYLPQIIQYIEQKETPHEVCQKIKLCSSTVAAPKAGGQCSICESIVGFVEAYVEQNQTVTQIEQQLDNVCQFTGPYAQLCDNLVSQYVPQLIAYVEQDYTPQEACTDIGLCSSVSTGKLIAPKAGGQCSICESIVGFVEAYVEQNQTVMQIEQQLDNVCQFTGPYAQLCDNLVSQYVPQLIAYVEQDYTPEEACTDIGLCSNIVAPALIAKMPSAGGACSICESIVGFVEAYVEQNQTVTQIEQQLDNICQFTGPYAQLCDNLVSQYVPQLIAYVEQDYTPEEACTDIGLCSAASLVVAAPHAGGFCSICESIVGFVESYVAQNQTEMQIEQQLDQICNFAGPYAQACDNLVENYVPQLIAYVEQDYTPEEACTDIGVCSAVAVVAPKAGGACSICESIVGFVEAYVEQNQTVMQIEQQLDNICQFTGPYAQLCDNLVAQYLPQLIAYVEQDYTPEEACTDIGLCSSSAAKKVIVVKVTAPVPPPPPPAPVSFACQACEFIVSVIEPFVNQNGTVTNVTAIAEGLCKALPSADQSICQIMVDQYVPVVVNYIQNHDTPTEVCAKIKLCTSSASVALVAAPKASGACSMCDAVVGMVEAYLADNQTVAEIDQQLDQLCNALGSYSVMCQNLVDAYLPQIVQYIEKNETPAQVCAKVGLCDAMAALAKQILQAKPAIAVPIVANAANASPALCGLCKTIVSYVELFLSHGSGEMAIAKQLHSLCALTQGFKAQCDALVDNQLPSIIQWVEDMKTPTEICALVKMCDKPTPAPSMP
jgi:saposin